MNITVFVLKTLLAVFGVDPVLSLPHGNTFNRPLFSPRVESDRHGDTTAERSKQQRVRIRTSIFAACCDWFIGDECLSRAVAHFVPQVCLRSYDDVFAHMRAPFDRMHASITQRRKDGKVKLDA